MTKPLVGIVLQTYYRRLGFRKTVRDKLDEIRTSPPDRGSQYTSDAYRALLAVVSAIVSISRTGNCYDNAVTESFFGTLKGECVERTSFKTQGQARQTIFEYVECFYNRIRRHSSLGYVSPVAYEQRVS